MEKKSIYINNFPAPSSYHNVLRLVFRDLNTSISNVQIPNNDESILQSENNTLSKEIQNFKYIKINESSQEQSTNQENKSNHTIQSNYEKLESDNNLDSIKLSISIKDVENNSLNNSLNAYELRSPSDSQSNSPTTELENFINRMSSDNVNRINFPSISITTNNSNHLRNDSIQIPNLNRSISNSIDQMAQLAHLEDVCLSNTIHMMNELQFNQSNEINSNRNNINTLNDKQIQQSSSLIRNGSSSLQKFSFMKKKTMDVPHIHLSLKNAINPEDSLYFYASSLEIEKPYTIVYIPITNKVHDFYNEIPQEGTNSISVNRENFINRENTQQIGISSEMITILNSNQNRNNNNRESTRGIHLRIRILYHEKLEQQMRQWFLVSFKTQWDYLPELRFTQLYQLQQRQHRREIMRLNVVKCDNTTCALNRDHLGQCDNGKFIFFSNLQLEPFDEIQYEVAKEGKCRGSIQMVLVTKRFGEIVLCETPIYSTGNWQKYQWQEAILGANQREFLKLFLRSLNHHRVERVTLGFYFLGSYGICNVRSIRFLKYYGEEVQKCMLQDQLFCDLIVN